MAREIGIDLGTANVLIHLKGRGVILSEPAVVAFDRERQSVIAVGKKAYHMIGRTGQNVDIVYPLKGGVIADFELAEAMLMMFFDQIHSRQWLGKPDILISTPTNISEIEQTSLMEAVHRVGGGNIYIEEGPKVVAIGAGIDFFSAQGSMIIDLGAGTTDIAVVSAGELIHSRSLKIAGTEFDTAIIHYFRNHHQLLIGQRTAEEIKIAIASATLLDEKLLERRDLKGRDLITGLPKAINVNSNDIFHALEHPLHLIARAAKETLEDVSPEIAGDIMEKGIILTGGGALIYNIDTFLSEFLHTSVIKADQPMTCAAIGTGLMLDMIQDGKIGREQPTFMQRLGRLLFRIRRKLFG